MRLLWGDGDPENNGGECSLRGFRLDRSVEGRQEEIMKVRVIGRLVEVFSCDCPDCESEQEHIGRERKIDQVVEVENKFNAEHKIETDLFETDVDFNEWESYHWEEIKVKVL